MEEVERLARLVSRLRLIVREGGHGNTVGQSQVLVQQADLGKLGQRMPRDGVRLGKTRLYGTAFSRGLGCPLASVVAVVIVLYAFLAAALRCLD